MKHLLYLGLALGIYAAPAEATTRSIVDWDGGMEELAEGIRESKCAKECLGYDITTVACPEGETLTDCAAEGCQYYHRCESGSGYEPSIVDTYTPPAAK